MKIDWDKYTIESLPHTLRRVGIFSILQVLISQIKAIHASYLSLKSAKIKEQSGNSQVCMLKKMVSDQLNLNIDIAPDTGLSNDFIVKVDSLDVDKERRLVALINKYKLAGKSFTLNNAAVVFTQSFAGYVCEKASLVYGWGGYVCELAGKEVNVLTIDFWKDVAGNTGFDISAALSPVRVTLVCGIYDSYSQTFIKNELVTHIRETQDPTPVTVKYPIVQAEDGELLTIDLLVIEDDQYKYELNITTWPNT